LAVASLAAPPCRAADDHVAPITQMAPRLRAVVTTPTVIAAVKAQNVRHATLTQADINRLDLQ
jgi:hypothetical protein